jgi:hypothetical protein
MRGVLEPFSNPSIKASRLGNATDPDTDFEVILKMTVEVEYSYFQW